MAIWTRPCIKDLDRRIRRKFCIFPTTYENPGGDTVTTRWLEYGCVREEFSTGYYYGWHVLEWATGPDDPWVDELTTPSPPPFMAPCDED